MTKIIFKIKKSFLYLIIYFYIGSMLSNSSKYAIKAVLFLAINSNENRKLLVKEIAESIEVPQAYIAKLLQELSRQKLISSARGPKGGFYLNDDNMELSLINIIEVIDGEKRIHACVLDLEKCDEDKPCPLHHIVHPGKSKFLEYLKTKTIREFSEQLQTNNGYFPVID